MALTALLVLGGCGGIPSSSRPEPRPDRPAADATGLAEAPAAGPVEAEAIRASYARSEADLRSRGLLRTDRGGAEQDGLDAATLAATFVRVAMYDEFDPGSAQPASVGAASALRRWAEPVRVAIEFGPSVPEEDRRRDTEAVIQLVGRLGAASRHPMSVVQADPNLIVAVVDDAERRNLAAWLRRTVPGISPALLLAITGMPISESCLTAGFAGAGNPFVFQRAIVVVRSEQPPLSRLSCYHEEIAQSLGLVNDAPEARPSIFNDDEEFALLTGFDEMMLAILYDPRLAPGMTVEEVAPLAAQIAAELMPETAATAADAKES